MLSPYIALTDFAWFEFLSELAHGNALDEVNFWSPRASRPMKTFQPGEPIFLRLKRPHHAIAGYGFFAHHRVLPLDTAWALFGPKNGDPDEESFLRRIGEYREVNLLEPGIVRAPLGCHVLREVHFWPRSRWISWREPQGWKMNTEQGNTERDPARARQLLEEIDRDAVDPPADLTGTFTPLEVDERRLVVARSLAREGQGTFKVRLLAAYQGRCAITGEHTEPVLDAAHIQRYLGPRSNHIQNGLLLTKEFHALFDAGYVTVTPDYQIQVSPRLHADWNNGARYYSYDRNPLAQMPSLESERPSRAALEWHYRNVFKKAG